jgi:hypothetical protein
MASSIAPNLLLNNWRLDSTTHQRPAPQISTSHLTLRLVLARTAARPANVGWTCRDCLTSAVRPVDGPRTRREPPTFRAEDAPATCGFLGRHVYPWNYFVQVPVSAFQHA